MHVSPPRKRPGPLARIASTTLGVGLSLGIVLALSWVGARTVGDAVSRTGVEYAGQSAAARAGPARSVRLRKPSGTSAGDVLVASFTVDSRPKITQVPRGWTPLLPERLEAGRSASLFAYYRVVGVADAGTKSWSWRLGRRQAWSGGIARYSGVDTDHPVDTSVSVATSGSAGPTFVLPGVRTTRDGAMLIGSIGAAGRISATPPAGWSEAWDIARGEASVHAHGPVGGAGKTGDVTWRVSTARSLAGWTTALRPDQRTSSTPTVPPAPTTTPPAATPAVLVGVGDIAGCDYTQDSATAALVNATPGTVFTLGDNAYPNGAAADYANCYQPTWGSVKDRTRPVVGNHEYVSSSTAVPYFTYFGAAAGEAGKGWYSYDVGTDWHVVVLNSNCAYVGGCGAGSLQEQWLRADLAASTRPCTVAMWHHPRFSSGEHGNDKEDLTTAFWAALYADGAELVLNGHDHDYERFAPQNPSAVADPTYGIRQFVVGTGGQALRPFGTTRANSEVRSIAAYGVLKLSLNSGGYDWAFLPVPGGPPSDSGSGTCHGAPS
jgi:hypothetical protein